MEIDSETSKNEVSVEGLEVNVALLKHEGRIAGHWRRIAIAGKERIHGWRQISDSGKMATNYGCVIYMGTYQVVDAKTLETRYSLTNNLTTSTPGPSDFSMTSSL